MMNTEKIEKKNQVLTNLQEIFPNLSHYDELYDQFSWEAARKALAGLPDNNGLNIAYEALDRHVMEGRGKHLAFRWPSLNGKGRDISYEDMSELSNRFASALDNLGIKKGETVFTLLGRIPELYTTAMGTLKHRAVFCPLYSAFGPRPIQARMSKGSAKVLVTTLEFYQKKVLPIRAELSDLKYILIIDELGENPPTGTLDFHQLLRGMNPHYEIGPTSEEDPALLHFTSGTTGTPKGALHVHKAVLAHYWTGRFALDLHKDDIFWCTADPGWVTGTSYGIISPLVNGVTSIIDDQEFDANRWYEILENEKVSVWYTAPTALRMTMKSGTKLIQNRNFSHLRFIASVGEPLNPETIRWGMQAFNLPIHDNWWQTETGGIMIANFASMDIHPGSMGKPLPGVEVEIVERTAIGLKVIKENNKEGELAIKIGWPSMFRTYLHDEERYKKCFKDEYYLTGDLARKDEEGYFWFVGRADDIIKSAGHLIGPFEVESVLMEHPSVAEAAVIGRADPVAGEVVKAFVVLKKGKTADENTRLDIQGYGRKKLGPSISPKEVEFIDDLPKTRSGKVMRRLLKARDLGLPEGDTSTLEAPHS